MSSQLPGPHTTMAGLMRDSAGNYEHGIAVRFKNGEDWIDVTYGDLWARVRDVALGLVAVGVEAGDRVAVLCDTRWEFTVVNMAISTVGGVVVPVYPTNSSDECEWVIGNSGSKVMFCENRDQVAKVGEVRSNLGELETVVVIDGSADGTLTLDELVERGRTADDAEIGRRIAASTDGDACIIIYTSGTTGRPKGVVLTNAGFAAGRRSAVEMGLFGTGAVVYLFLPLAHIFGQLIQADTLEVGGTIAYWSGSASQIIADLAAVKPNVLPSVPRIFEKVYAMAMASVPEEYQAFVEPAVKASVRVRLARRDGVEPDPADVAMFDAAEPILFGRVREIFGGNVDLAISGAAPIAKEILEFFYACGVPVMEGWGMTETTAVGTLNLPEAFKLGTIGREVAGATVRIADDGEIELAGPILMKEYWKNPQATADAFTDDHYLRTGDLGAVDDEGYVTITGRKKDIIITAGGKNLTPANLEGDLRRSTWISQAVMYGDRRPYPVALITLDAETIVPWATKRGLPGDVAELADDPTVIELIQSELDRVNSNYARVEQVKRFKILDRDFTIEDGELTPSLKLKRNVVYTTYADEFSALYT